MDRREELIRILRKNTLMYDSDIEIVADKLLSWLDEHYVPKEKVK